jgi:hypothetical protein
MIVAAPAPLSPIRPRAWRGTVSWIVRGSVGFSGKVFLRFKFKGFKFKDFKFKGFKGMVIRVPTDPGERFPGGWLSGRRLDRNMRLGWRYAVWFVSVT